MFVHAYISIITSLFHVIHANSQQFYTRACMYTLTQQLDMDASKVAYDGIKVMSQPIFETSYFCKCMHKYTALVVCIHVLTQKS
jgi:hypothetical protein